MADIRRGRHAWLHQAIDAALSPREQHVVLRAGALMERLATHQDPAIPTIGQPPVWSVSH